MRRFNVDTRPHNSEATAAIKKKKRHMVLKRGQSHQEHVLQIYFTFQVALVVVFGVNPTINADVLLPAMNVSC